MERNRKSRTRRLQNQLRFELLEARQLLAVDWMSAKSLANATGIAGLTNNIQMVTGGSGADVLKGRATASTILIGMGENDTLVGGNQD